MMISTALFDMLYANHMTISSHKHNKMAGYKHEYNFLREFPDSLNCILCLEVAKEAHQHESCRNLFCKSCYKKLNSSSCPTCRKSGGEYFADKLSHLFCRKLYLHYLGKKYIISIVFPF